MVGKKTIVTQLCFAMIMKHQFCLDSWFRCRNSSYFGS